MVNYECHKLFSSSSLHVWNILLKWLIFLKKMKYHGTTESQDQKQTQK